MNKYTKTQAYMTYISDWRMWNLDIVCMKHKHLNCFQKANIKEDISTNAV